MPKSLELRVGAAADALDRFEAAWHRAAEGRGLPALSVLTFRDLGLLLKTLTPARWALLERLKAAGPVSVYALAKSAGRNYKNVHADVAALLKLGLAERQEDGRVRVPWDVLRAELAFEY